jgi:hypothetical protein
MKRTWMFALGLMMLALPVEAQLFNFPTYSNPSAYGMPGTFIAATYGHGMNDASGKLDAYGAAIGRTGLGGRFSIVGAAGLIDAVESEVTFGGTVGVDLLPATGSTQISAQAGVGYFSPGGVTFTHFPIGVALKTQIAGPTATVTPWVMPRVDIQRASASGVSATDTEFGVSAGFGVTLPSGFGVHSALDLLAEDTSVWVLGVGVHYVM